MRLSRQYIAAENSNCGCPEAEIPPCIPLSFVLN